MTKQVNATMLAFIHATHDPTANYPVACPDACLAQFFTQSGRFGLE
jgi:hypothetical protein